MDSQDADHTEEIGDSPLGERTKNNMSLQERKGDTKPGTTAPTSILHRNRQVVSFAFESDVDADSERQQRKCLIIEEAVEKPLMLKTQRRCYTHSQLENTYRLRSIPPPLWRAVREQCRCSKRCVQRSLLRFVPVVSVLRHYNWPAARADMISGLSVGFLHLPQGLGFGLLASLSPVYGLYTSLFPILVYIIFGTSPHVSMGTNAVVALLTAAVVDREADIFRSGRGDNQTVTETELLQFKVGIATASCFIGGLMLMAMGLMRLGFLTNFMSKSFIGGFSFAAAVHITVSQVARLLHLHLPNRSGIGKLVYTTVDIISNISDTKVYDVVMGLVCAVILLGVNVGVNERYKHKLRIPIPIELIVVVLSTLISHLADLNARFGIDVVGHIPHGMPAPSLPPLDVIPRVGKDSFVTAILIFVLTISMGKLTAKLHDIEIDDNQELVAYGLCQLVGSFFQNFFSSISPPRTMMLSAMGVKSTLNGVTSAMFLLLVLLVVGKLFVSLPIAMLAAMIIVAMKDLLLQVSVLKLLWHVNKSDFFIWLLTAVASVLGDLDIGLLVGVIFSMVTVLMVSQLAKGRVLGKADKEDIIMDMNRKGINAIPGVRIFRFESELHFANAERFKSEMFSKIFDPTADTRKDCYEIEIDLTASCESPELLTESSAAPAETPLEEDVIVVFESDKPSLFIPESRTKSSNTQGREANVQKQKDGSTSKDSGSGGSQWTKQDTALTDETNNASQSRFLTNHEDDLRHVIVDCSNMTYIDMSGIAMLHLIIMQFSRAGVAILLTDIPPTTMGILTRAKFFEHVDNQKVYFSIMDALTALRAIQPKRGYRKSFA